MDDIFNAVKETETLKQCVAQVHDEVDRRVLETAEVIGVTTSGLAKRISVLRHIHTKVVICEEAGEVLEAHMLSALVPSVESLIQIGVTNNSFDPRSRTSRTCHLRARREHFTNLIAASLSDFRLSKMGGLRFLFPSSMSSVECALKYPQ